MQAVIGALRAVLGLDSVAFEKGVDQAKTKLGTLEKSFTKFGASAESGIKSALAGLAAGLSIGALAAFRKHIIDIAGGLDETAQKLGVTSTQFQAYRFATEQAGVKSEELEAAFVKLNDTIGKANDGNKEAVEWFKGLGVNILDAADKVRPSADIFDEVIRKIAKLDSAGEKTAKLREGMGRSAAALIPALEDLSKGVGKLEEDARKAGNVIEKDVIDALDRTGDKALQAKRKWDAVAAVFIAKIEGSIVDQLTKETNAFFAALERVEKQIGKGNVGLMDMLRLLQAATHIPTGIGADTAEASKKNLSEIEASIINVANAAKIASQIGAEIGKATDAQLTAQKEAQARQSNQKEIERLEAKIAEFRDIANANDDPKIREAALARIAGWEAKIADLRQNTGEMFGPPMPPKQTGVKPFAGAEPPSGTVRVPTTGVKNPPIKSTGQSPEERAKQNIDAWKTEMKDFQASLKELEADSAAPLEDVEKRLESQRRVTERIRQGLKGLPEGSPLKKQIEDQAKATEEARFAFEEYMRAAKDADAAEKEFGDGSVELAKRQRDLGEAMKTGRLSIEAQRVALDEAARSAELQRLKMIGLTDQGWGGFIAGLKTAQMEWDRANNAFAQGQQFFQNMVDHMSTALEQFVTTGKLKFREFANSVISDLIRMALKAASTNIFGALGSLFGIGGSTAGGAGSFLGILGGPQLRAAGGPVFPGIPYIVGEQGPELMVPTRAGNIVPNEALGGGWGGATVNQNITINGGDEAGVMRALTRMRPVLRQDALDAVMDARNRGGPFAATFRK